MADNQPSQLALGDNAARQLANATKTAPTLATISPRWLLHLLQWIPVEAGIYRLIAHMPGFSQVARRTTLAADTSNAEINFVLTVGNLQSEVTVTASRSSRDTLVVPLRVESLGEETMAATNPASSGELMTEATGVTPVGSGPFQMRPRLRGLDSTRVLILVDGERLNNARTATDRAGVEVGLVDAASIENIEVVSGAGSVLYGTDALSGTINILTAQPNFSDKTRFIGNANGYYSSNENGLRGNLGVGVAAPRYALNISGGKESFDNYTSGGKDGAVLEDSRPLFANGTLKQTDTIDTNFGFNFKAFPEAFNAPFVRTSTEIPTSNMDGTTLNGNGLFAFNDKNSLKVKYFHREAKEVGFPDFVPPQFFQGIVLPYSKLDKVSARYEARLINSWFSHLAVTGFYQKQDRLLRNVNIPVQFPAPSAAFFPISVFRLVINSDTGQKVKTQGFDVQGTFLASPRNVITAGLTYYQDDSADYRTSSTQTNLVGQVVLGARGPAAVVFPALVPLGGPSVTHPTRVPNATFSDLAAFAQDEPSEATILGHQVNLMWIIIGAACVFFGVLGGLSAFGVLGLFVGPVLLSVSFALLAEFTRPPEPSARAGKRAAAHPAARG